jgi:hypothetical protein
MANKLNVTKMLVFVKRIRPSAEAAEGSNDFPLRLTPQA